MVFGGSAAVERRAVDICSLSTIVVSPAGIAAE
jgi:hypothetical protein